MSESDHLQNDDEERHRVRKRLRGLERHRAPWYFDAQLQQRLRRPNPTGMFSRPFPSYAFSLLAVLGIGVVSYYTVFKTPTSVQEQSAPRNAGEMEQKLAQPNPVTGQDADHKGTDQLAPVSKGPSGQGGEVTIESHIEAVPDEGKTTSFQRSLQQPSQEDQPSAYETTLPVDSSATAKEDSLARARPDSLKR